MLQILYVVVVAIFQIPRHLNKLKIFSRNELQKNNFFLAMIVDSPGYPF